jgi:hypothetical protein
MAYFVQTTSNDVRHLHAQGRRIMHKRPTHWLAIRLAAIASGWLLAAASTGASAIPVMDFEGLQHREHVDTFYNGGHGSLGSGPGPDFDIDFSPGDEEAFNVFTIGATAHSGTNILTVAGGSQSGDIILNVDLPPADNANNVLQFFYGTVRNDTTVTLYDGAGGAGNAIGSSILASTGTFFNWTFFSLRSNPGTVIASARIHAAVAGGVVIDDMAITIPAPSTLSLVGLAAVVGGLRRKRRHRAATRRTATGKAG